VHDTAAEARERNSAAVRALHCELVKRWPTLFDPVVPKPLVIGIDRAIRDALPPELGVSRAIVGLALAEHVGRREYQIALAAPGAMRHGLDGAPCGKVTVGQAARAAERLAQRAAPAAPPAPCAFTGAHNVQSLRRRPGGSLL
jgi:sRNA-binding protein